MRHQQLLLCVLLLAGCYRLPEQLVTTVPDADIPRIERGITLDELRAALQDRTYWRYRAARTGYERAVFMAPLERTLTHEFTVRHGRESVVGVSSRVVEPTFLFVLIDGTLAKIVPSKSFGPLYSIDDILGAESMSQDAFATAIRRAVDRNRRVQRHLEPVPMPPFIPVLGAEERRRETRRAMLEARYDPLSIALGSSIAQVEHHFGPPVAVHPRGAEREALYGDSGDPGVLVAVAYRDDRVVGVYSHHFLPKADITPDPVRACCAY